jgi:phosphate transport system permease protein
MVLCALSIFSIVALIAWRLVVSSQLTWDKFGLGFFYQVLSSTPTAHLPMYWDPVNGQVQRGAVPLRDTLVSSFLALLLAVPLAIGRGGLPY